MAELLVEYTDVVLVHEGRAYMARTWGAERDDGKWEGWLEFVDPASGHAFRSARETTQPDRGDTIYWASGLTAVYLEGAFDRALDRAAAPPDAEPTAGSSAGPARRADPRPTAPDRSILNPFSVYRNGETLLRQQLSALSAWHLVNIIEAHGLSDFAPDVLNALPATDLIELVVEGVKRRPAEPLTR